MASLPGLQRSPYTRAVGSFSNFGRWPALCAWVALLLNCLDTATPFSIGVTGDVNLNPLLKGSQLSPEYVWG